MPNTQFDKKSFNPEAFGRYIESIPDLKRNSIVQSGAIGSDENARQALSNQTGTLYARVPYFGNINADSAINNNGATDITTSTTETFERGFIVANRAAGWTEKSFSTNITAGVDFMDHVGNQIATKYKPQLRTGIVMKMLEGIFKMTTTGSTPSAVAVAANKAFVEGHTYDISANTDESGYVGATTLNNAMQQACGDNKDVFTLVFMHSAVATNLENLQLLKYWELNDANGLQRQIGIGSWNGRTVIIDDGLPVEHVPEVGPSPGPAADAYDKYTTYVLGASALILDDIGDPHPYEVDRDPAKNAGTDMLYVRDRFICGAAGLSFEKPSSITASASNTDLATGTNWVVCNNGTTAIDHRAIPIARIISRG